jgi:hypothetical protein
MAISKDGPLSSEREAQKLEFLAHAGLADARRDPLPGDASTRSYERLIRAGKPSLMLMNSPPAAEGATLDAGATEAERIAAGYAAMARLCASRIDAFVAAARFLRSLGLSAPEIVAFDVEAGFAVIEDLGDGLFVRRIEAGEDEGPLYRAAVEALAFLQETRPPAVLDEGGAAWPLLTYDDLALKTGADLFIQWLPKLETRVSFDAADRAEWDELWRPARQRADAGATVFAHRDYHAENLLWLPERAGVARVGMIDFQDCVLAHPSWDLHSLLQDARRDVPPALEAAMLDHYFSLRPGLDRPAFMADYAALAALNEARIIGIFSRLIARDRKPRYRSFLPRMWRHLMTNLEARGLADVRAFITARVPEDIRS